MARQRADDDEDDGPPAPGGVTRLLRLVGLNQPGQQAIQQANLQSSPQANRQAELQADRQAGRQANPTGRPTGNSTAEPTAEPTGRPTAEPTGSATGSSNEEYADYVPFYRVGDTFEPASSHREQTPAERATDFLQTLQGRGLGGGWVWRSDLEGIYGRFQRDFGLTSMSWTAVMRGLSEVTDKRRKERARCLPNGDWQWTEMQYYVPRPKKKPPAE